MATKLYLRHTPNNADGLPTSERSTLIPEDIWAPGTINRTLSTTKGTVEQSPSRSTGSVTSVRDHFIGKWVSSPLTGVSSISANTWTYGFSAKESSTSANFPVSGTNQPVYVNCYVWRPSTSTNIGTILDGNTASTVDEAGANVQASHVVTFSGSAVSSVQDGDVIILEVWFQVTQSTASSFTLNYYYDGTTEPTENATESNIATYVETPQDLTFSPPPAATRFYFHAATNATGGLPTAEQSSLTANKNAEGSQTTNRQMNTTVGTSEANIQFTSIASTSQQNNYITRFVSPVLGVTSIAANIWTYAFGSEEESPQANFPVSDSNKSVHVNCYVWRPSTSTKIGTVLDGNTAATVDEVGLPGSYLAKKYHIVRFTGSAVSSIQTTDVLIFEVWFRCTQSSATAYTDTFYYDGTTEYAENEQDGTSISSFLETPQVLAAPELVEQTSIQKYDIRQNIQQTSIHEYDILETGKVQASSKHKYKILTGEDGFTVFMRLWIPFFNNEVVYGKRGILFSKIDDEQVTYGYTAQLSDEGDIYFIVKDNSREYSLTVHDALEFETASPPDFTDSDFNSMDYFTVSSLLQSLPEIIPYDDIAFNYEFTTHRIQIIKNGQIIADTNNNPEGSGLVAWFRLNEGGDIGDDPDEPTAYTRTVYNSVDTGENGIITNGVWTNSIVPHETYLSLSGPGTADYITISNYPAIQTLNEFTISLWYRPFNSWPSSNSRFIISKNFSNNGCFLIEHQTANGGKDLKLFLKNNSGIIHQHTYSNIFTDLDQWYHIVCKWSSGSTTKLFVDNVKNTSGGTFTAVIDSGSALMRVSSSNTNNTLFAYVHDLKIWNRELSDAEVTTLYNAGHPVSGFPPWQANPPPPPEIPLPITNPFEEIYNLVKPATGTEWSKIHKLIVSGITETYTIPEGEVIPPSTIPFTARYSVV